MKKILSRELMGEDFIPYRCPGVPTRGDLCGDIWLLLTSKSTFLTKKKTHTKNCDCLFKKLKEQKVLFWLVRPSFAFCLLLTSCITNYVYGRYLQG